MSHLTEEELIRHFYGEAEEPEAIAQHLEECPRCTGEDRQLRQFFGAVDTAFEPDPVPDLEARVWQRLEPHLGKPSLTPLRAPGRPLWTHPGLIAATLAVLALGVAFLVGDPPSLETTATMEMDPQKLAQRRQYLLLDAVEEHLEDTQRLLQELVNTPAATAATAQTLPAADQAHRLVAANRLYRGTARNLEEAELLTVLEGLERVLMEVSHSSPEDTAVQLAALGRRIDEEGLLFEVRLAKTELQIRLQQMAQPNPTRRRT